MPRYRLAEALDRIATYATDLRDTVVDSRVDGLMQYSDDGGESYRLDGHRFRADGSTYLVAGNPELRFVTLVYPYDIRTGFADDLRDGSEGVTDETRTQADETSEPVGDLFGEVSSEAWSELRYRLRKLSVGSDALVEFIEDDPARTRRVVVVRSLFPYEQTFSIERFAECRSQTVSLGEIVQTATERAITVERDDTGDPSLTIDTDRV